MTISKQQKERDNAVLHLFEFIEKSDVLTERLGQLMAMFMRPVEEYFDEDEHDIAMRMERGPYGEMIYSFFMEMLSIMSWDGKSDTPIEQFLKKRGRREGTHGRLYLRALLQSEMQLLEVTAVEQGRWVEVRPFGTNEPPERIIERSGSTHLHVYDALVARLVPLSKSRRFGAMLPLTPNGAQHLKEQIDNVESDLKALYEEAVAEDGADGLVVNFVDAIDEEKRTRTEEIGFMCFAIDALDEPNQAPPQMFNTDDERIVVTKTRFPMVGDVELIRKALNEQVGVFDDDNDHWSWIKSDGSNTVLGSFTIQGKHLVFESNSVERSEQGVAMLQSCLGDALVGTPMSVHENITETLKAPPSHSQPSAPLNVADHPELQIALQDMMKNQYLKALDEDIPMLDNESPRACAADPEKRHKAVDWLKYLENMESKSPNPPHDFSWMWEELGLVEYR